MPGGFLTLLVVSLLLGLVNAVLGPLLHLVALPLTLLTLGTFALVVNGVLLAVTAGISDKLDVDGLGSCILGALVIAVVTTVLELVLRPVVQVGQVGKGPGPADGRRSASGATSRSHPPG